MIISDLQYLENASDSQLVEGSAAFASARASALAFGKKFASATVDTFTVTDYLGEFFASAGSFSESASL